MPLHKSAKDSVGNCPDPELQAGPVPDEGRDRHAGRIGDCRIAGSRLTL